MDPAFRLKTYVVAVDGFPAYRYLAATPAKARARAWVSYCSYRAITFREFLRISSIRRGADDSGFGRPILVGGQPAFWCGFNGQYVEFVRPHRVDIVFSHPADVNEVPA